MNIEALRMWSKHDQGHASTFLSLADVRLVVEAYDLLVEAEVDHPDFQAMAKLLAKMEGDGV